MAKNRLGLLGHYYNGMLDIYTDLTVHHCAIGVGNISGKLKKLAALLGIEMQTVCRRNS